MNIWSLHKEHLGLRPLPPVSDPKVNHGAPTPCYEMTGAINTKEGWNALADKHNARAFQHYFGREPESVDELDRWVNSLAVGRTPSEAPMDKEAV